jgi:TPP-dependent pyruvate/acetoin dehydrogenase alpha subunit
VTPQAALEAVRAADVSLNALDPKPFPLPVGELAPVVAGAVSALRAEDWWVPSLRERVGAVVRNVPVERLVDGRRGAKPYRVAPSSAAPALRALVAVGLALADRQRYALVHLGIGSASDGALYEALNLAALHSANVLFVVSVHPLGDGAPLGRQLAARPSALAAAFGIPATTVHADAAAVHAAVKAAREATGPHLIEVTLPSRSEEARS